MSDSCGGCSYCKFPYKARLPIATEKGYETRTFNNIDDVWDVINLLIMETKQVNRQTGKEFDIVESLIAQIPFFACISQIRDEKYLKLINKYIYCTETNTPAYKGSYSEQPARWVQYFFIIKNALAKKQKMMTDKMKKEAKHNGR